MNAHVPCDITLTNDHLYDAVGCELRSLFCQNGVVEQSRIFRLLTINNRIKDVALDYIARNDKRLQDTTEDANKTGKTEKDSSAKGGSVVIKNARKAMEIGYTVSKANQNASGSLAVSFHLGDALVKLSAVNNIYFSSRWSVESIGPKFTSYTYNIYVANYRKRITTTNDNALQHSKTLSDPSRSRSLWFPWDVEAIRNTVYISNSMWFSVGTLFGNTFVHHLSPLYVQRLTINLVNEEIKLLAGAKRGDTFVSRTDPFECFAASVVIRDSIHLDGIPEWFMSRVDRNVYSVFDGKKWYSFDTVRPKKVSRPVSRKPVDCVLYEKGMFVVLYAPNFPVYYIEDVYDSGYDLIEVYDQVLGQVPYFFEFKKPLSKPFKRKDRAEKWSRMKCAAFRQNVKTVGPGDMVLTICSHSSTPVTHSYKEVVMVEIMKPTVEVHGYLFNQFTNSEHYDSEEEYTSADCLECDDFELENNTDTDTDSEVDNVTVLGKRKSKTVFLPGTTSLHVKGGTTLEVMSLCDVIPMEEVSSVYMVNKKDGKLTEVQKGFTISLSDSRHRVVRHEIVEKVGQHGVVLNGRYYRSADHSVQVDLQLEQKSN